MVDQQPGPSFKKIYKPVRLMRIRRTLPPAAAPIYMNNIINGITGIFRGQKEIERFRAELKNYFGVKHCFLVSSGKTALTIILQALHELHPNRDEVLIPAFTCYSVPSAIVRAGLKVKLCDVSPETFDFDFNQLEELLTSEKKESEYGSTCSRLLAILPTHLFGLPSDITKVKNLLPDPVITIVEDAAQAMGGEFQSKKLGTLGDIGFFSLGRGKVFSTVEGGIIVTDNESLAEKIKTITDNLPDYTISETLKLIIQSFIITVFQYPCLFWFPKAFPFLKLGETIFDPEFKMRKITGFQAGMARNWEKAVPHFQKKRKSHISSLTDFLCSKHKKCVIIGKSPTHFIRLPVLIKDKKIRTALLLESDSKGYGLMPSYPNSINNIQELAFPSACHFSVAENLSRDLITLPVHPLLNLMDLKNISTLFNNN